MNNIIINCTLGIACIFVAQGDSVTFDRNVSIPVYPQELLEEKVGDSLLLLREMLVNNELEKFYEKAKADLQASSVTTELTKDELVERLWILYYISLAPMYPLSLESGGERYNNDDDISVKYSACTFLDSIFVEKIANDLDVQVDQIKFLYAEYYSRILKNLRESYDPLLEKKEKNRLDLLNKGNFNNKLKNWEEGVNYRNHLGRLRTRNEIIKFKIDSLEEDFAPMLVRYFSNKAKDVRKYLKMAGYENREANDLIDRSIGRNPKTEFLYKGRPMMKK